VSDKPYLLEMAEHFYAVAQELIFQGERSVETGKYLGAMADRMREQNMRETDKTPPPLPLPAEKP